MNMLKVRDFYQCNLYPYLYNFQMPSSGSNSAAKFVWTSAANLFSATYKAAEETESGETV